MKIVFKDLDLFKPLFHIDIILRKSFEVIESGKVNIKKIRKKSELRNAMLHDIQQKGNEN